MNSAKYAKNNHDHADTGSPHKAIAVIDVDVSQPIDMKKAVD